MNGVSNPMTVSAQLSPVRKRAAVINDTGTRLAKYISILLLRLTARAATTEVTAHQMNRWLPLLPGSQHSQRNRPQDVLVTTCISPKTTNQGWANSGSCSA